MVEKRLLHHLSASTALSVREFRRLDGNSAEMGVPVHILMRNAGRFLAAAVERQLSQARHAANGRVLLLCGKGNNGGDGFAAARVLLDAGHDVQVVCMEPRSHVTGDAARSYLDALPADRVFLWRTWRKRRGWSPDVVVDCLLGSGIHGAPRPPYDAAVTWINRQPAPVVSCDVPSGFGSPHAVRPTTTVTFHARKEGMSKETCGSITVADIGIPRRAATDVGLGDLDVGYPRPGRESHKGDNGIVLVVGGGPYLGAPYYAGLAALRTGADLGLVEAPGDAATVLRSWGPDLIVHDACPGGHLTSVALPRLRDRLRRASALVVGPGLGTDPATREAVRDLLDLAADADMPVVVDADGLDAVTPEWLARHGSRTVLTPHAREFQDLSGRKAGDAAVRAYARRHGVVVLRKGVVDLIAGPGRWKRCRRGHPTMTAGGTGDVLAGTVGALLAKGAEPFDAACAAAYLVGCAGEVAATYRSYGATAMDVLEAIPAVLLRLP